MKYEIDKAKGTPFAIQPVKNIERNKPVDDKIRADSKIRPVKEKIVKIVTKNIFKALD